MGALYCGETHKFLKMSEILSARTNKDLSNKIIARVDDESHINKYVVEHSNVRTLSPAYLNPDNMDIPFEKKIIMPSKTKYFDVLGFKIPGYKERKKLIKSPAIRKPLRIIKLAIKTFFFHRWRDILAIRDSILCRHL